MRRIVKALAKRLSRPETPVVPDQSSNAVSLEDVVMPDIYGEEPVDTVPDLKYVDIAAPESDNTRGFNPYDTAVLRKK